ncbi:hypothetical protein, partial [Pseudacidovorax intermedius]
QDRPALARRIDEGLQALLPSGTSPPGPDLAADAADGRRELLAALVGLRRNLYPTRPWPAAPSTLQEVPA